MKITLHPFLLLILIFFCLDTSNAQTTISVSSRANIFGAGKTVPPAPGGGGAGILPPEFLLDSCSRFLEFPNVTGTISCCGGPPNDNDPDGGSFASGSTDISSFEGISGIIHNGKTMFLAGVFLNDNVPSTPAPNRLNFSTNENFSELFPELDQTFFIGDGRTGTGTGLLQKFYIPSGATRLFVGFIDGLQFDNQPGYYFDNAGQLTVEIAANDSSAVEIINVISNNATCGVENGSISILADGGCGQLRYSIDGTNFIPSNYFWNLADGSYTVFVEDQAGNQDTQTVDILLIEPSPVLFIDATATTCGASNGTITIDGSSGNYEFSINGTDYQQGNVFFNLDDGNYTVYTKDENNCIATDNIQIDDSPKLIIDNIDSYPSDCGESTGGFSIDFEEGTGQIQLSLDGGNPQNDHFFSDLPAGDYQVQITDDSECVIDTTVIIDRNDCPLFVPNAFSPNNDGINDLFQIYAHPEFSGAFITFRIFDRWGSLVFSSQNFNAEKVGWDGTFKGKELGMGVFIYLIEYQSDRGKLELLKGDVTLLK